MTNVAVKRGLVALGAAVVLGGAAVGAVGAQTPTPTRPAQGTPAPGTPGQRAQQEDQFLAAIAGKLGVTVDRLKQAMADARKDLGLPDHGRGFGFGSPGGPGHRGPGGPGGPVSFDVAAQAIGITPDQLRQELAGKSLSDVAKAHNVDPAKVSTALKNDAATRIDQAVTAGRLPADRAAQAKQDANTRIDQLMTQALPQRPADGQRGPGFRGPRSGGPGPQGTPGAQGTPGTQRSSSVAPPANGGSPI